MDIGNLLNQISPLIVLVMTWLATAAWKKWGASVTGITLLVIMAVIGTGLTILNNLLVSTPNLPIVWQFVIAWASVFLNEIIKQGQPKKVEADKAFNEDTKLNPPPK